MTPIDALEKLTNLLIQMVPRKKPSKQCLSRAKVIAHRGVHDNRYCFENTLEAFDKALAMGLWGIEFDLQATKDDEWVVHHDDNLKRLWGSKQCIRQMDYAYLKAHFPQIPTLREVIQRYRGKMHFFIEIKNKHGDLDKLHVELKTMTAAKDFHVIALEEGLLKGFSFLPTRSLLLVASATNVKAMCEYSLKTKYGGVLGHHILMRKKRVQQLYAAGQVCGVGFVDSKFSMYRELSRGVNWLFSNNPAALVQVISCAT